MQRASPAALVRTLLRALLDTLIVWAGLAGLTAGISYYASQQFPSEWLFLALFIITCAVIALRRWQVWSHSAFRVTSERILLQSPLGFFHSPLRTIKWAQYQESYTGHQPLESPKHVKTHDDEGSRRHFTDYFFAARPLCIRFGTPDAHQEACFPSLRYANDLKHYLDKVDSAVRRNDLPSVHPFVAKPKGKRDDPSGDQT